MSVVSLIATSCGQRTALGRFVLELEGLLVACVRSFVILRSMKSEQSKVIGSALCSLAPGVSLRPTGVLLSFTLAITDYEASGPSVTCQEFYLAAQLAAPLVLQLRDSP